MPSAKLPDSSDVKIEISMADITAQA